MRALWLLACLATLGCSSRPSGNPNGGSDLAMSSADAGADQDAGPSPPSQVLRRGTVNVLDDPGGGTAPISSLASARFFDYGSSGCSLTVVGACQILDCSSNSSFKDIDAGDITVGGGVQPVSLTPTGNTPNGPYVEKMAPPKGALNWSAGAAVSVSAAGGVVPAFSAHVTMPAAVTLTAPMLPAPPAVTTMRRDQDLELTWTGGGNGTVYAALGHATGGQTVVARCLLPAAPGKGVLPKELLAMLPATIPTYGLEVLSADVTSVTAGDTLVTVAAFTEQRLTDGRLVGGDVTFQ